MIRVTRTLVACVMLCRSLSFASYIFSFGDCVSVLLRSTGSACSLLYRQTFFFAVSYVPYLINNLCRWCLTRCEELSNIENKLIKLDKIGQRLDDSNVHNSTVASYINNCKPRSNKFGKQLC